MGDEHLCPTDSPDGMWYHRTSYVTLRGPIFQQSVESPEQTTAEKKGGEAVDRRNTVEKRVRDLFDRKVKAVHVRCYYISIVLLNNTRL